MEPTKPILFPTTIHDLGVNYETPVTTLGQITPISVLETRVSECNLSNKTVNVRATQEVNYNSPFSKTTQSVAKIKRKTEIDDPSIKNSHLPVSIDRLSHPHSNPLIEKGRIQYMTALAAFPIKEQEDCRRLFCRLSQEKQEFYLSQFALQTPDQMRNLLLLSVKSEQEFQIKKANKFKNAQSKLPFVNSSQHETDILRLQMLEQLHKDKPTSSISIQTILDDITLSLKVAKTIGCDPWLVTTDDKQNYKRQMAQEAENSLLSLPRSRPSFPKNSSGKQKKGKGKKQRAVKTSTHKEPIREDKARSYHSTSSSSSSSSSPVVQVNILEKACNETIIDDDRVTKRWESREISVLKNLRDHVEGNIVYRYAQLSDREILKQRAFHYLPGIEQILIAPLAREKFTFKTDRGCGMFATLIVDKTSYNGLIYFGVQTETKDLNSIANPFDSSSSSSAEITPAQEEVIGETLKDRSAPLIIQTQYSHRVFHKYFEPYENSSRIFFDFKKEEEADLEISEDAGQLLESLLLRQTLMVH